MASVESGHMAEISQERSARGVVQLTISGALAPSTGVLSALVPRTQHGFLGMLFTHLAHSNRTIHPTLFKAPDGNHSHLQKVFHRRPTYLCVPNDLSHPHGSLRRP